MTSIPRGEVSSSKFTTAFGRAGCGMKFYYRYIEGIRGTTSASLLAGIAFDEATRQYHDNLIVGEQVDDPRDVFVDRYENPPEENRDGEPIEYDLSDAPDDIIQRGLNALGLYVESARTIKPVATQVFVQGEFEETDAKLIGYIDVVEQAAPGQHIITDVKTSLSARKKWTAEDAARDPQLGIYAVLWQHQNPDVQVTGVGWRHARLGGKVDVGATHVGTPPSGPILQRVAYWMSELERWCETGNFPATGPDKDAWVCSEKYCDYYQRCPHGAKSQTIVPLTTLKRVTT